MRANPLAFNALPHGVDVRDINRLKHGSSNPEHPARRVLVIAMLWQLSIPTILP